MKKLLTLLLVSVLVVCTLGLFACGESEEHTHKYETKVVAPTCTENGYTIYTCQCGDTYNSDTVEALGHSFTNYIYNFDATTEQDGTKTAFCDRNCGAKDVKTEIGSKTDYSQFEFELKGDSYTLKKYIGTVHNVYIPLTYNDKPITSIGDEAFLECAFVESVEISNNITSIGNIAFGVCSKLKSITIPKSVASIGYAPFGLCENLTELKVDSNNQFYIVENGVLFNKDKTNLICYLVSKTETEYVIPNTVKVIGDWSISYCNNLENIIFPSSVEQIGDGAFQDCEKLKNITIPCNVKSIGNQAFFHCYAMEKTNFLGTIDEWAMIDFGWPGSNPASQTGDLYINDVLVTEVNLTTATKISKCAFVGCKSIEKVTISESVKSIGGVGLGGVFSGVNLTQIFIPNTVLFIGYCAFACSNLTIYCEAESLPSGWDSDWNYSNSPVVWGYTGE